MRITQNSNDSVNDSDEKTVAPDHRDRAFTYIDYAHKLCSFILCQFGKLKTTITYSAPNEMMVVVRVGGRATLTCGTRVA